MIHEKVFEGWWRRELWSFWQRAKVQLWHWWVIWHFWHRHLKNVDLKGYWGIWHISLEIVLGWHPQVMTISSKIVLLRVLLELNSFVDLLVHLIEVIKNTILEFIICIMRLNSIWVIREIKSHNV